MVQRLPAATKEDPDPRGDLDRTLDVFSWRTPTSKRYQPVEPEAPSWWRGDEEATDTFMRGMGVANIDQLRR